MSIDDYDSENVLGISDGDQETLDFIYMHMQSSFQIPPTEIATIFLIHQGDDSDVFSGLYEMKKVAVKVLPGTALIDAEREKFNRQVQILMKINHENIVKFIGSSVENESTMKIVLEFLENSNPVEHLIKSKDSDPVEVGSVLSIALSTAKAMEYLHSQGIIHNNLISSNILVTNHCVKLTGFGNATEVVDEANARILRQLDVFAFGKLLQELLQSVIDRQLSSKEDLPESLEQLMGACMSKDPENRPEFTLIRQNLENILESTNPSTTHDLVYGEKAEILSFTPSSTIYRATYNSRPVAVKIYGQAESEEENNNLREIYDREVGVLSRVNHQNIVELIGATTEPKLRVLTEFMEGGTLERFLLQVKPDVPHIEIIVGFALEISQAMEHLHSLRITHRNLKSSHVFLTKDKFSIKLGGFGQAREETPDDRINENFKEDVYDFSRILWELLTNKHADLESFLYSIPEKRPILVHVPDVMVELLESCGSEIAEDRPEFNQITDTLRELCDTFYLTTTYTDPTDVVPIITDDGLSIEVPSKREGEVADENNTKRRKSF